MTRLPGFDLPRARAEGLRDFDDRLASGDWMDLCRAWLAVRDGASDPRHGGCRDAWICEIKDRMPISFEEPGIATFAAGTGDADILEGVYRGITPHSHLAHIRETNAAPTETVFRAFSRFRRAYPAGAKAEEIDFVLRHAVSVDMPDRLPPDYLADRLFRTVWRDRPELFEPTGPRMAPLVARWLEDTAATNPRILLAPFLALVAAGAAKSAAAVIAAGFNPVAVLQESHPVHLPWISKCVRRYDGEDARLALPAAFRRILRILDPERDTSMHERIAIGEILSPGAAARILARPAGDSFAGLRAADWPAGRAS